MVRVKANPTLPLVVLLVPAINRGKASVPLHRFGPFCGDGSKWPGRAICGEGILGRVRPYRPTFFRQTSYNNPRWAAWATAADRDDTLSLARVLATCRWTVCSLMKSRSAIA